MKFRLLILLLSFFIKGHTQSIEWHELVPLPEKVSNNAVTTATVGQIPFVYSFAGIDTTKDWFGIHLRAYRYSTQTGGWESIASLPDPMGGKIAAAASTVKNRIYIIGGYHVASNYSETSSNKVHIYDPESNSYLPDGTNIPIAIDDQVQAVWRDSLIYVITGWSNVTNVANVQIYNPAMDEWMQGTPVPNSSQWKVFGASGTIIGDTIYYAGGARAVGNFPAASFFRKGYINTDDPSQIIWEGNDEPLSQGYRMAAASFDGKAVWFGGSEVTYNFDGIAYNGSGGVAALDRVLFYDPSTGAVNKNYGLVPAVMDLRGLGQLAPNQFILAGGMMANQHVTDKVFLLTIDELTKVPEVVKRKKLRVFPNPATDFISIQKEGYFRIELLDTQGKLILEKEVQGNQRLNLKNIESGLYLLKIWQNGKVLAMGKLVINKV